MPDFTIDFEVVCEMCGDPLKATTSQYGGINEVQVSSCDTCINKSYDEGFESGQEE